MNSTQLLADEWKASFTVGLGGGSSQLVTTYVSTLLMASLDNKDNAITLLSLNYGNELFEEFGDSAVCIFSFGQNCDDYEIITFQDTSLMYGWKINDHLLVSTGISYLKRTDDSNPSQNFSTTGIPLNIQLSGNRVFSMMLHTNLNSEDRATTLVFNFRFLDFGSR